jgi:hypothetical protein
MVFNFSHIFQFFFPFVGHKNRGSGSGPYSGFGSGSGSGSGSVFSHIAGSGSVFSHIAGSGLKLFFHSLFDDQEHPGSVAAGCRGAVQLPAGAARHPSHLSGGGARQVDRGN